MTRLNMAIACLAIMAALVCSAYGGPPVRPKALDKTASIRGVGTGLGIVDPSPSDNPIPPTCPAAPNAGCTTGTGTTGGPNCVEGPDGFWSCSCNTVT